MCRIRYINRDVIDSTNSISSVLGKAFHKSMQTYYGGNDEFPITNEAEGIEMGLKVGMTYLEDYNEGWLKYNDDIPNKQKAFEKFAFVYNEYIKVSPYSKNYEILDMEKKFEDFIDVEWRGQRINLPIKLKGYPDKVIRGEDGKIRIIDYKCVKSFDNPEKINGSKMLQSVMYYFLVYAKYGEAPYSFIFEEAKHTKNSDDSKKKFFAKYKREMKQVENYEVFYEENELFFDFFFRYYQDVTDALNGKQVYVPNVTAMYDGDISIISYIHRLDEPDEQAKQMKKLKVDNITDLLKKKIQSASSMKMLMQNVDKEFVSAKNLNYEKMNNEEKIQTKMLEHGMMLQFDSKIEGCAIDLYRYTPTIGLKMSKIANYVADVEQVLGTSNIRVLAPIPNSTLIGFEVPRKERSFPIGPVTPNGIELCIGVDILGENYYYDISSAPHMLVAGATGSGKSVFLHSIVAQLSELKDVEIHLYDPKVIELKKWKHSQNVLEYQTDKEYIHASISILVDEMNKRYREMDEQDVSDFSEIYKRKFIIIDEFGDITDGEIQENIRLLAQKARAAGIHLIISTQRPSVDIITGSIKSNFPCKAVFRTSKAIDSHVVMDEAGAEKLLGKGDMLFVSQHGTVRLQGFNL